MANPVEEIKFFAIVLVVFGVIFTILHFTGALDAIIKSRTAASTPAASTPAASTPAAPTPAAAPVSVPVPVTTPPVIPTPTPTAPTPAPAPAPEVPELAPCLQGEVSIWWGHTAGDGGWMCDEQLTGCKTNGGCTATGTGAVVDGVSKWQCNLKTNCKAA